MLTSAVFYAGLRSAGITALARRTRQGGVILCYHNVVPQCDIGGDPGLHLASARFRQQLLLLSRCYTVVPLREFSSRLRAGRSIRGVAAITFDDGYDGVFETAWPILRGLGLPATVFIPTGRHAQTEGFWWDQAVVTGRGESTYRQAAWPCIAQAAAEGCEIGVHSSTHRVLTQLSDEELQAETLGSRRQLAELTGVDANSFSYPYGLFDARVRAAVYRAGYETAVTLDFGLNGITADPLALRRMNVPASISAPAFEAWLAGLRPRVGETI